MSLITVIFPIKNMMQKQKNSRDIRMSIRIFGKQACIISSSEMSIMDLLVLLCITILMSIKKILYEVLCLADSR
nr:MAG TPA: hypothetical protein [Caudoviricetes sp.]